MSDAATGLSRDGPLTTSVNQSRVYRPRSIPSGGPQHRIPKIVHADKPKQAGKRGRTGGVALLPSHPAVADERSLFPGSVIGADESPRLLIDGVNSHKVGKVVTKGGWKGMPIFTLTLEERSTCPRSCEQWLSCYGNNMPFARRHRLDDDLMIALKTELRAKQQRHPAGFVVRAHILGDFGSPDNPDLALTYVGMWHLAFRENPALRMFSYTAHDPASAIGKAIRALNVLFPDRCRVRFSGRDMGGEGALVIDSAAASRHVVCPAQTDATDCCATCALCWSMDRTVEFVRH
jgi:hypothetical protein